ncbi:MAG: hypothetical protein HY049_11645 [Acidobacteria bacterium]|nr:hypothetical protein [Acidobacteriota bacterium]
MAPERRAGLRIAFFGAMAPLAREVRERLESASLPASRVSLYDSGEFEGSVTEFDGEAMIVQRAEPALVEDCDLAFICSSSDARSVEYVDWIARAGGIAVDLAGATRGRSGVPLVNCDVNPEALRAGGRVFAVPGSLAHPLSTILHRLSLADMVRRAEATIFRPAAEFGERGVEELHRQTVALLSFAEIPRDVLGRQSAFNLFPISLLGETGREVEESTRRDVLGVLRDRDIPLAVRVIQAPVFHGHAYSIHVEFDGAHSAEAMARALRQEGVVSVSGEDDGRSPAELAAEPGIWVAEVAPEPQGGGAWIWAVTDAIRSGVALNAVRVAGLLAEIAA